MNLSQYQRILGRLGEDYDEDAPILERLRRVVHRAAVVQTLPEEAPVGYLIVKPGDPFLYVGRGAGQRLARTPLELIPLP